MSRTGDGVSSNSRPGFSQRGSIHKLSNQLAFLAHTSPAVPVHPAFPGGAPYFLLDDLWKAFDEPSAFGVEIPFRLHSEEGNASEVTQCYVPYLSALQLFEPDRRWSASRCLDDGSDEDLSHESTSSDSHSISSSSIGSEEEKCLHALPNLCDRHRLASNRRHLLFEFQETASPHMREPLTDRVRRLAQETKRHDLLCLRSCDLHPHSWFSVAWYPLYRIPAGGCLKELSACFLTFHPMTLPLQWSRIAALPKAGKAGSLPPFPLRAGLADPALQPPAASPAVAAALAPALDERRAAAARILSQGLPARHMLTFLMPFAFVPYKAQGRAWLDTEAAAFIHASMVAAAIAWNKYVGCKHPDLDFFARSMPASARAGGRQR